MGTKRDTQQMGFVEQLDAAGFCPNICSVNHQQVTRIDASNGTRAVFGCGGTNEHVKMLRMIRIRLDQFCYTQGHRVIAA